MPNRTSLALHTLAQQNFTVYAPKIRELRIIRGHKTEVLPALFPGYAFVLIRLQWHAARWCPGVIRPGDGRDAACKGARRGDQGNSWSRTQRGDRAPRRVLKRGDRVRILAGPFRGHLAIYAGMAGHQRITVLLEMLGRQQRVTLADRDVGVLMSWHAPRAHVVSCAATVFQACGSSVGMIKDRYDDKFDGAHDFTEWVDGKFLSYSGV
jgi:transcriptional antiterminator RfaH